MLEVEWAQREYLKGSNWVVQRVWGFGLGALDLGLWTWGFGLGSLDLGLWVWWLDFGILFCLKFEIV